MSSQNVRTHEVALLLLKLELKAFATSAHQRFEQKKENHTKHIRVEKDLFNPQPLNKLFTSERFHTMRVEFISTE